MWKKLMPGFTCWKQKTGVFAVELSSPVINVFNCAPMKWCVDNRLLVQGILTVGICTCLQTIFFIVCENRMHIVKYKCTPKSKLLWTVLRALTYPMGSPPTPTNTLPVCLSDISKEMFWCRAHSPGSLYDLFDQSPLYVSWDEPRASFGSFSWHTQRNYKILGRGFFGKWPDFLQIFLEPFP